MEVVLNSDGDARAVESSEYRIKRIIFKYATVTQNSTLRTLFASFVDFELDIVRN